MMLMVEAMKAKVGNPGRKLVLVKLADNANDKGECWPSYQHVADQCEMGRSTVKVHIKALEEAGFLTVVERNGGKSSNRYRLHIDAGKVAEKQTRSESDPVKNEPGQNSDTPRSESDPHPRSNPDPRTSHSPEPVIEPVDDAGASSSTEAEDPFRSSLFSPDLADTLPASTATATPAGASRDVFEMHHDWQPSEIAVRRYMARHVSVLGVERIQDELDKFRLHYQGARPERQGQWEKKFLSWLGRAWPSASGQQGPAGSAQQQKRAAITSATMNIHDTDW